MRVPHLVPLASPLPLPLADFAAGPFEQRCDNIIMNLAADQDSPTRDAAVDNVDASRASRLRVVVRVRPQCRHDGEARQLSSVECEPRFGHCISVKGPRNKGQKATFSAVLGLDASQHDVYKECGVPLLDALFSGTSACMFAYGQTGSGKTYSMIGAEGGRNPSKSNGVIPQAGPHVRGAHTS